MKTFIKNVLLFVLVVSFVSVFAAVVSEKSQANKPVFTEKQRAALQKQHADFQKFREGIKDEPKYNFVPRGVLIFLDDSEASLEGSSIGVNLECAIADKAGPIIASTSLLANIKNDSKKISWDGLIIKKINESLNLIIPISYLKQLKVTINGVKESGFDSSIITDLELQLGLKVNHMDRIEIDTISRLGKHDYADYFIPALFNNETQTSSIFCTRSDYHVKNTPLPLWSIYMLGHGKMNSMITYLKLEDFKKVLDFFEEHINTRLFIYDSCYAAGVNTEAIYKDAKLQIQKTYSFPIITMALTDAPTLSKGRSVKYGNFFKIITEPDSYVIDYKMAMEASTAASSWHWGNAPQIKLPGVEWFSVMQINEFIAQIRSVLTQARDPNKALDVVKFFKTDPHAILLYAKNIPFKLIVNSSNMSSIISMIPGDATHKLKRVSSTKSNVENILKWFMNIEKLNPTKTFFIEEVHGTDGEVTSIIVRNEKVSGNVGLDILDSYLRYALFEKNSQIHSMGITFETRLANEAEKSEYETLNAKMKGTLIELETIEVDTGFPPRVIPHTIPHIQSNCIIKKIIADPKSYYFDIVQAIKNELWDKPSVIAWVNEISTKYDTSSMDIPNFKFGDPIIIKDVVFKGTDVPLFTYDGKFYRGNTETEDYRDKIKQAMTQSETSEPDTFGPIKGTLENKNLNIKLETLKKSLTALKTKLSLLQQKLGNLNGKL